MSNIERCDEYDKDNNHIINIEEDRPTTEEAILTPKEN